MLAIHEGTIGTLLTSWTIKGKSPNTVRLIRACLSAMFADAADTSSPLHLLVRNPVALAGGRRHRRAERKRQKAQKQRRVRVLTPAERNGLLVAAAQEGLTYRALFAYMADSGPRPGEALKLHWEHINWENATAWIWATKTSTERTVDLSARTIDLLKRLRVEQQKQALKKGAPLPDSCFLNRHGLPIDQSRLTKRLKRSLERAGLPTAHGLYDVRHTYATIALSEGRPPTTSLSRSATASRRCIGGMRTGSPDEAEIGLMPSYVTVFTRPTGAPHPREGSTPYTASGAVAVVQRPLRILDTRTIR
jgi:integrase